MYHDELLPNQLLPSTSLTAYDALSRPIELTTPHKPSMQANIIRPTYNEANLLESIEANLQGAAVPTPFVTNVEYDAKGQRQRIDYGNGVSTFYDYNPLTFRLEHLRTMRNAVAFPDDCPPPARASSPGCQVQNLHYSYDPVGNITHIRDDAQQAIYFKNKRVEPSADYTYDALYQLIEASGREHLGQGGAPIPHSHNDANRVGVQSGNVPGQFGPNDITAMGVYIERYVYDAVGNFLAMQHRGSDPTHAGWTRSYSYAEPSQLEPDKQSNRLTSTTVGNANPITETYSASGVGYDAHGNMLRLPHLSLMQWDFRDQLQATARQVVNGGGTRETTWYVYNAGGERVRKLTASTNGQLKQEHIYLGGFEIYRDYNTDGTVKLQRETLHMMDDSQRIALVETRTLGTEVGIPEQLIRYQFGNHLGSASLELDHEAKIISYEEYTPYGSTAYQAGRSQTEVKRKQYRYTGMERDEESGFGYHGWRYFAFWLGRWISTDPIGLEDGLNLYQYARGNPISFFDLDGFSTDRPPESKNILTRLRIVSQNTVVSVAEKLGRFFGGSTPEPNELTHPIANDPIPSDNDMEKEKFESKKKTSDVLDEENRQNNMKEKKGSDVRKKRPNPRRGKYPNPNSPRVKPPTSQAQQNALRRRLGLPERHGPPPTKIPLPPRSGNALRVKLGLGPKYGPSLARVPPPPGFNSQSTTRVPPPSGFNRPSTGGGNVKLTLGSATIGFVSGAVGLANAIVLGNDLNDKLHDRIQVELKGLDPGDFKVGTTFHDVDLGPDNWGGHVWATIKVQRNAIYVRKFYIVRAVTRS